MPVIENEIAIERTPDEVWAVLGDLEAADRWVPGLASVRMDGTRRICTLEGGGEIHEEISARSDERRSFSYTQTVHPLGLARSEGALAVQPVGDGAALVVWRAEVELADPAQERQVLPILEGGYAAALGRLKEVVEAEA